MKTWRYAVNLSGTKNERTEVTELVNAGVTGKWMPVSPRRSRRSGPGIVEATEVGRLGRVGKDRLTCVYTKNCRDKPDVVRVCKHHLPGSSSYSSNSKESG